MSVSVASFINHANRMRRIILACLTCPALPHFSTLRQKQKDARKTVTGLQMSVLPLKHMSGTFLVLTSEMLS